MALRGEPKGEDSVGAAVLSSKSKLKKVRKDEEGSKRELEPPNVLSPSP